MVNYFSGSVGDAISVMVPDVYISDDGGYSWAKMLEGPHYYTILDSGGVLVAIEHSNRPINVIKYACSRLPTLYIEGSGGKALGLTAGSAMDPDSLIRFCSALAKALLHSDCVWSKPD